MAQRSDAELQQSSEAASIKAKVALEPHGLLHLGAGADDQYKAILGPFSTNRQETAESQAGHHSDRQNPGHPTAR